MVHILKVKNLVDGLDKISYNKEGDAAIDLRASGNWIIDLDSNKRELIREYYDIMPSERILIKTGIKVAIPQGHYGHIKDRSGLAFKHGLHVLAGVIDENYRDEIGVVLVNLGKNNYKLTKNERIAQMIIKKYEKVGIAYVDELDKTIRDGGFGSSGTH